MDLYYNRTMKYKKTKLIEGVQHWLCPKCNVFFARDGFYKNKQAPVGITSYCKKCHMEVAAATRDKIKARQANREYARRARKADPEKFRKRARLASRRRVKGPAYKAYRILNNAVAYGKIEKPLRCETCNKKHRLTAHHEDYSKPLEVEWLCYECHGRRHWKVERIDK